MSMLAIKRAVAILSLRGKRTFLSCRKFLLKTYFPTVPKVRILRRVFGLQGGEDRKQIRVVLIHDEIQRQPLRTTREAVYRRLEENLLRRRGRVPAIGGKSQSQSWISDGRGVQEDRRHDLGSSGQTFRPSGRVLQDEERGGLRGYVQVRAVYEEFERQQRVITFVDVIIQR